MNTSEPLDGTARLALHSVSACLSLILNEVRHKNNTKSVQLI